MKYTKLWSLPLFTAGQDGYSCFRIPSVITLPTGRVLAFAEGRRDSMHDSGAIDIVMKISDDGGRSFGPLRVVVSGKENTAGNPCPAYDKITGKIVMLFNRNDANGPEQMILKGKAQRTVHMTVSSDMGDSWANEKDVTLQTKLPLWTWHATGPCHAVQMPSGRLVVPCNHAVLNPETEESGPYISHTLFSDDHGESWQIGADVEDYTNECTLAALEKGDLLINMRNFTKSGYRYLAVSHDEGGHFEDFHMEESLPEPCCQGSMLSAFFEGKEAIFFSNPACTSARVRMMIHESTDGGKNWTEGCLITDGPAAYSDLTMPCNQQLAILYETGSGHPYEKIEWTVFQID